MLHFSVGFQKLKTFLTSECLKFQTSSGYGQLFFCRRKPVESKKACVLESRQLEK